MSESYYSWLKNQSPEYQDSILGEKSGMLLRDGALTSEKFIKQGLHKRFKPITLDELNSLESLALSTK